MQDLSIYVLVVVAHVLASAALVGGSLTAPIVRRLVCDARTPGDIRTLLHFARLANRWNPVIAMTLLATGIYLGSYGWWTQAWFYAAIVAWIANSALVTRVVHPIAAAIGQAAARAGDGGVSPELDRLRRSQTWMLVNGGLLANNLGMLYLMFAKPALAGTVATLVGANVVSLAVCLVRYRGEMPPAFNAA